MGTYKDSNNVIERSQSGNIIDQFQNILAQTTIKKDHFVYRTGNFTKFRT